MSDLDLDALEAVAQAATPGEWEARTDCYEPTIVHAGSNWPAGDDNALGVMYARYDANYAATFDPPTVLALIAELRDSRARIAALEAERDEWRLGISQSRDAAVAIYRERAVAAEQKVAALAEVIERLTNQVERIRDMHKPIPIYPGDCQSPDDDHDFDPAEEFCRGCEPEFDACGECRDEDGSWIEWPCETALAADPNAWVDDLVRLAAAPTPPAEGPRFADRDAALRAADDVADRDAALLDRLAGNPTPPTEAEGVD